MMFKLGIVTIFLSLLTGNLETTSGFVAKPTFKVSYSGSQEGRQYAEFVKTIYEELGFDVTIIATPAKRGLMLLNDNLVDADVIRLKTVAAKYENLILVEPPFAKGSLVLLCHKDKPCNFKVLQQKTAYIQTDEGTLKQFEKGDVNAQIVVSEMSIITLKMLEEARIFYALHSFDNKQLEELASKFNYVKIKDVSGYHVINKKHANLLPQIQQKFREKLPAFNTSRN